MVWRIAGMSSMRHVKPSSIVVRLRSPMLLRRPSFENLIQERWGAS